ncbi:MAG: protein kinase [Blastocatellia bacterium]|nr:protein kinase [Blastocatellia bacterium]
MGWLLWTLISPGIGVLAQTPGLKFIRLSLEQGLSQSSVLCMLQDRQGFLWLGTQDGLNRYDGYEFLIYRHDPQSANSLCGNRVAALLEDSSGQLWIGTNNGLCRFDRSTQRFQTFANQPERPGSLQDNHISALCEDKAGHIWVGTTGGGLHRFAPARQNFEHVAAQPDQPTGLGSNHISCLTTDRTGVVWVGTTDQGLYRLNPGTGTFFHYGHEDANPATLSSNSVRVIVEDTSARLWIGTADSGLDQLDRNRGEFRHIGKDPTTPNRLGNESIRALCSDRAGLLWVGTDHGLNRLDPATGTVTGYLNDPQNQSSLSHNDVRSLFLDSAGSLWVGTLGGGVNRLDQTIRPFTHFAHDPRNPNSLSHNGVRTIAEDSAGRLWVGTNGGGLNCLDRKTGQFSFFQNNPKDPNSLSSNRVWCLSRGPIETLWVGTFGGGLNHFDPNRQTWVRYQHDPANPNSLGSNDVWTVLPDRSGLIWVGTQGGGLNRLDPANGSITRLTHAPDAPQSLSSNDVSVVFEDRSGTLWVGTPDAGLNRLNRTDNTFQRFQANPNRPNSLSSNSVRALFQDKTGTVWVGTEGGLNRFDLQTETFTSYTTRDGLPNDVIYGILEDWAGNLWLSTNAGLCKFHPNTKACHNYDIRDGLQSNEFNAGASFQNTHGEMFFGGINGFNTFHPEGILDNPYVPPVVISRFLKFDKKVENFDLHETVVLRHDENYLAFEFAALNFTLPEKNQYAYQLEGFDRKWILCGTRRYASYTNLDPGEYVFRVKGSNNDGVWNEEGIQVRIRVLPPLWRTWWAYGFYCLAAGGSLIGAFHIQNNRAQARARLQEAHLRAEAAEIQSQAAHAKAEAAEIQAQAAAQLAQQNAELDRKNKELAKKNDELIASQQQADRIFSALAEALAGTVLDGKYRLEEKIGAGGFGAVFKATHLALNRYVAVKVFKPKPGNDSADAIERFKREGVSASRLNHPNAIQVLDSGISTDGIAYLVMELLTGHSLADELHRHGHLSLRRCMQIIPSVCEALVEAHRMGIIHRDIKPENIFLNQTPTGEVVKVLDFGVAKMLSADTGEDLARLTMTGGIVGTPVYMAPERLEAKPYDGRSDVYSVGIMFYEMLTGDVPFKAESSGGLVAIVMAHLRNTPERLSALVKNLPPEVEHIVMCALAKDPNQRPTAAEFSARLFEEFSLIPPSRAEEIVALRERPVTESTNLPTESLHFETLSSMPTVDTGSDGIKWQVRTKPTQ